MQYAVIKAGGKQHKVTVGDTITLNKIEAEKDKKIVFDEVLLVVNDGKITLGKPSIANTKVEASLIEHSKGDKIRVMRFKAKSRYRRTIGFRAQESVVKIDKIDFGSSKKEEKADETVKTAPKSLKK